ncbi:MAG: hypothetical protein JSV34_06925, partial [Candidatus Omnitrophota bacterium]
VYDLDKKQGLVYSSRDKKYKAVKDIFVFNKGRQERVKNEEADFDKGVLLARLDDKYKSIILESELIDSLFSRLYLLEGEGLQFFEPFYQDEQAQIYVYKIKWEGFDE